MVSFKEFMSESKMFTRWDAIKIGLFGGFCGALLTVTFMIASFVA